MDDRLKKALQELAKMKHPSVEEILHNNGYGYEARIVKEVVDSFEDSE
jgi:hypothetical protein